MYCNARSAMIIWLHLGTQEGVSVIVASQLKKTLYLLKRIEFVFSKLCKNGKSILTEENRGILNNDMFSSVAFPNRKSIIFDNKLDFSGIKLAES